MDNVKNVCKDCAWFVESDLSKMGHCHRYAPNCIDVSTHDKAVILTNYPVVDESNFCGEFRLCTVDR